MGTQSGVARHRWPPVRQGPPPPGGRPAGCRLQAGSAGPTPECVWPGRAQLPWVDRNRGGSPPPPPRDRDRMDPSPSEDGWRICLTGEAIGTPPAHRAVMTSIQISGLTKRFGNVVAVDNLSFEVAQGSVTGFLGPNGAGKTTTLRMLLGLIEPTAGRSTKNGKPYQELVDPFRHVGAVLESTSFHPGRRARDHLRV